MRGLGNALTAARDRESSGSVSHRPCRIACLARTFSHRIVNAAPQRKRHLVWHRMAPQCDRASHHVAVSEMWGRGAFKSAILDTLEVQTYPPNHGRMGPGHEECGIPSGRIAGIRLKNRIAAHRRNDLNRSHRLGFALIAKSAPIV